MGELEVGLLAFLLTVIILGLAYLGYCLLTGATRSANLTEHFIAVNLTKDNGTCRLTWLGGWDFDSFYTNVTVNGVNMEHPDPMTVIYNDTCKDLIVKMHDKAVHSDIELYRYNHMGGA